MSATVETLGEQLLDLAWSLWGGLGVSSWIRRHTDWLVEVEPLVAFTAHVGEHDRRLLGESTDWCVQHDRFLSLRQLRHVVTGHEWPSRGEIARFSATVQAHTGRRWPHAENAAPYAVGLSGKSRLPDLAQPGLLQLRLRALFGVGARAEILRLLLVDPTQRWTLGELAGHLAYTRRQLSNEVDMLSVGGVLRRVDRSGVAAYRLADRAALVSVVGRVPTVAPSWAPLLCGLLGLGAALDRVGDPGLRQPAVELQRQLWHVEPALAAAGLRLPRGVVDEPDSLLAWSVELAGGLAQADPSRLPTSLEGLPGCQADASGARNCAQPRRRPATAPSDAPPVPRHLGRWDLRFEGAVVRVRSRRATAGRRARSRSLHATSRRRRRARYADRVRG